MKVMKSDPTITGKDLAEEVEAELRAFGMKVFVSSYPPDMAETTSLAI